MIQIAVQFIILQFSMPTDIALYKLNASCQKINNVVSDLLIEMIKHFIKCLFITVRKR